MPTPDDLAAQIREYADQLADQVAALDDQPEQPAPVGEKPAKPTGLACVIGPDGKPVLTWDAATDAANWAVEDELDPNPATRVKDVVTEPRSIRSKVTATSKPRRYVIVAVGPTGLRSEPSDAIEVPAAGGAKPGTPTTPGEPTSSGKHPSDVLDLRNWTIMLPTGFDGDPDNAYMIGKSVDGVFFVEDGAVVFRTDVVNGVHSSGSKYPRTEAREMVDAKWTKAAWPSTGPRFLEADLAIDTSHMVTRRRCNGIQIHDGGDDVAQIQAREDGALGFAHNDGKSFEVIDPDYNGERFTCRVAVANDRITVFYNGQKVVDVPKKGTGWYWKIGSYAQSGGSSTFKEPAGAYAQVKVWSFTTGA